MRWPKDFEGWNGNCRQLKGTKVLVYQWNTGKNKHFMVEKCDGRTPPITIHGKGDEAMIAAIQVARNLGGTQDGTEHYS